MFVEITQIKLMKLLHCQIVCVAAYNCFPVQSRILIRDCTGVIVSKNQARSTDRGRRIPSKFSAFFLYQTRLRSVVFLVK